MSIECETRFLGVIRPPPESLEDRGKLLKSEPEPEPKPKRKPEPKPLPIWETKALKDLKLSDFSGYDDDIEPFMFMCENFTYRNKAQIKKDMETKAAIADYKHRSRNLSVFDAIPPPKIDGRCWVAVPLPITDARRSKLTPLCKLALDNYNAENQDANFVFLDIVKTTWSAVGMYYMTFEAQQDPPNCPVTTFQAQVFRKRTGPHKVISCSIKT